MNQEESLDLSQLLRDFEDEKRLIGYDLHDGIVQLLVGSKLQLDSIDVDGEVASEKSAEKIVSVRELLQDAIGQLRKLIGELSASSLVNGQLESELQPLVQKCKKEVKEIHVELSGLERKLDSLLAGTIYRIVQEGLNNVVKHSHASWAFVKVQVNNERINILILDNGIGFDGEFDNGNQIGLRGIANRARIFKGKCLICSHLYRPTEFQKLISGVQHILQSAAEFDPAKKGFAIEVVIPVV